MKKAISLLLILTLGVSFAGCSKRNSYALLEEAQREAEAAAKEGVSEEAAALPDADTLRLSAENFETRAGCLEYEEALTVTRKAGKTEQADSVRVHRIETARQSEPSYYFRYSGGNSYELFYAGETGYLITNTGLWKCAEENVREQVTGCMRVPSFGTCFTDYFTAAAVTETGKGFTVACSGATAALDRTVRELCFPDAEAFAITGAEGSVSFIGSGVYEELFYRISANVTEGGTVSDAEVTFSRTYRDIETVGLPELPDTANAEITNDLRIPLLLENMLAELDCITKGDIQEGLLFSGTLSEAALSASQVSRLRFSFDDVKPEYRADIMLSADVVGTSSTETGFAEFREGVLYTTLQDGSVKKETVSADSLRQLTAENIASLCGRPSIDAYSAFTLQEEAGRWIISFEASDDFLLYLLATGMETCSAGSSELLYGFTEWQGDGCTGQYVFDASAGSLLQFSLETGSQTLTLADGRVLQGDTYYELLFS